MTQDLKNHTAIISGASRGIGKAIALRLAVRGAHIVLNYVRNEEAAKQTAAEIEKTGVKTLRIQGNIADPKTVDALVEGALKTFGTVDILVHNAALGSFKPLHKLKLNHWDLTLDVNAKAFLLLVQKVLPVMEQQGQGQIITLSSLGSKKAIPDYGAIGVSKAALESMVRYFGAELAPKGIRVNCVSGGLVDTDAVRSFPDFDTLKKEVVRRTPAGRIGTADDLARVVSFLASDDASWIVGQTIVADGGLSLL